MFRSIAKCGICLLTLLGSAVLAQASDSVEVDIPAQPVGDALNLFAEQSGLQVVLYAADAEGLETKPVVGSFDDAELALDSLLASTGLEYSFINDRTVAVNAVESEEGSSDLGNLQPAPILMAQNQTSAQQTTTSPTKPATSNNNAEGGENPKRLEEIIVTGTNIRGVKNPTVPVISLGREDIDLSGVPSVAELTKIIPQNFASSTPLSNGSGNPFDEGASFDSTSIDLRGLGAGSTLTLLNGRRLGVSGFGNFFDVSILPISVIDRVDVLTDGASAIYGSDAVAGVVNFVTRRDFEGLEVRARAGKVSDSGKSDYRFGATGGLNWSRGGAFVSTEYYESDPLFTRERDFVDLDTANPSGTLFPEQENISIMASVLQDFTDKLSGAMDVIYTHRETRGTQNFGNQLTSDNDIDNLFLSAHFDYLLSDRWEMSVFADYTDNQSSNSIIDVGFERTAEAENGLFVIEAQASGKVFDVSGGSVTAAFGAMYRKETFDQPTSTILLVNPERDVTAVYAELLAPLIGDENALPFMKTLDLSLAGRFEDYSDFGNTFNPKVGLSWGITGDFTLRATYSEAFRASNLREIFAIPIVVAVAFPDPNLDPADQDPRVPTGRSPSIFFAGGNPNLTEEIADTWTGGFSFQPNAIPGLTINANYFDISYSDRIDFIVAIRAIGQPEFASFIDRQPSADQVAALLTLQNDPGIDFRYGLPFQAEPGDIQLVLNTGTKNLSSLSVNGMDLNANYGFETEVGDFNVSLNGSYLFDYAVQATDLADEVDTVDVLYRPIDFKARATLSWKRGRFTTFGALNYADGYTDNQNASSVSIDSQTTIDLTLAYETDDRSGNRLMSNARLSLSIQNLFSEDPPFVQTLDGFNFDAANASPQGTYVSVELSKRF